jgi:hypothetical protein
MGQVLRGADDNGKEVSRDCGRPNEELSGSLSNHRKSRQAKEGISNESNTK